MQQKKGLRRLKQSLLFKIAEMALESQEFFPWTENYQLHLNARQVGDEIKVSFYAIGDEWQDKEVTFSKTFTIEEIKGEKQMKRVALLLLCSFVFLTALAVWFFGR